MVFNANRSCGYFKIRHPIKVKKCLAAVRRMPRSRDGVKIYGEGLVTRKEIEAQTTEKEGVNLW